MTVGQFLQKLPKSVIKDGKVIDIRNSVGENLKVHKEWETTCTVVCISSTLQCIFRRKNKMEWYEWNVESHFRYFYLSRVDVKFLKADLDLFIFNLAFVDRMGKEYRRQSLWWRQTQSKISKRGKLWACPDSVWFRESFKEG